MTEKIIALKIQRTHIKPTLPYDKIYLINKKQQNLISALFKYALVIPLDNTLLREIKRLIPKETSQYSKCRNDKKLHVSTGLDGRSDPMQVITAWWEKFFENFNVTNRLGVIPILPVKKRNKVYPNYLVARNLIMPVHNPKKQQVSFISEDAYLATPLPPPDDKISPICSACPRSLLHLQGECFLGCSYCCRALNLNDIAIDSSKDD